MTRSMPFCSGGVKPRFVTSCIIRCNYLILHRVSEAVLTPVMTTRGTPFELGSSWGPVRDARRQGKLATRTRMFEVRCRPLLHETFQNLGSCAQVPTFRNARRPSPSFHPPPVRVDVKSAIPQRGRWCSRRAASQSVTKTGCFFGHSGVVPGPRGEPRGPGRGVWTSAAAGLLPLAQRPGPRGNTRTRSRAPPTFQRAAARGAARPSSPKGPSSQPL